MPGADFELQVWHEDRNSSVKISDHFVLKPEQLCINEGVLADDEEFTFEIRSNASLHLKFMKELKVSGPAEYCIMIKVNE